MYGKFMMALVYKWQVRSEQETAIFFYLTAQGPGAGYRKGEGTWRKTLLANRWNPAAVSGNEKLAFGKLGSICNNA